MKRRTEHKNFWHTFFFAVDFIDLNIHEINTFHYYTYLWMAGLIFIIGKKKCLNKTDKHYLPPNERCSHTAWVEQRAFSGVYSIFIVYTNTNTHDVQRSLLKPNSRERKRVIFQHFTCLHGILTNSQAIFKSNPFKQMTKTFPHKHTHALTLLKFIYTPKCHLLLSFFRSWFFLSSTCTRTAKQKLTDT